MKKFLKGLQVMRKEKKTSEHFHETRKENIFRRSSRNEKDEETLHQFSRNSYVIRGTLCKISSIDNSGRTLISHINS